MLISVIGFSSENLELYADNLPLQPFVALMNMRLAGGSLVENNPCRLAGSFVVARGTAQLLGAHSAFTCNLNVSYL